MGKNIYVTDEKELRQRMENIQTKSDRLLEIGNGSSIKSASELWRLSRAACYVNRAGVYAVRMQKKVFRGKKVKRNLLLKVEKYLDKAIQVLEP